MSAPSQIKTARWDAQRRAQHLHGRRDELLARLPRVIAAARSIAPDEREFVLDDSIEYIALRYLPAIHDRAELERVLWDACNKRTLDALKGRQRTVRNGYERVSENTLTDLADDSDETQPDTQVQHAAERDLAAEFAATLTPPEGDVLRAKYLSDTSDPVGYRKIAQLLAIPSARARGLERSIARKLDDFAATVAAGELCGQRATMLAADAAGAASELQHRVAHAHLKHCAPCKTSYKAQLRDLRSAEFGRHVASLLPGPVAVGGDRHGRLRDLLSDWACRLIGHDPSGTATQLAASGAGRGAGSVIGVKIAACLAGGAAAVSVCVATGVVDWPASAPKPPARRAQPAATVAPMRTPSPSRTPRPTATPKPKTTRPAKRRAAARTQGGTSPSSHEQAPASAAPAGSQPNGGSEFGPGPANSPRAPAAPVPAAPGSSEFP